LVLDEVSKFDGSLTVLFLLLLFSELEFIVTDAPEFSEFLLFVLGLMLLLLFPLNLKLSASLDSSLHLSLAALLLLEQTISFAFSLSYLSVQNFFSVVVQCFEISNLAVDHSLSFSLLVSKAGGLAFLLLILELLLLAGVCLDMNSLHLVSLSLGLLLLQLLLVDGEQVSSHLGDLLLTSNFSLFLSLEIFFCLAFDELTLKHLLFNLLDVAQLEVFQLVTQVLSIHLPQRVLLLKLRAHLLVILRHLSLLDLFPVFLDLTVDLLLAIAKALLCNLLVSHIAHQHLRLESLDHVLLFVHVVVGFLDLLSAELLLVALFFSIDSSAIDLRQFKNTLDTELTALNGQLLIQILRLTSSSSKRLMRSSSRFRRVASIVLGQFLTRAFEVSCRPLRTSLRWASYESSLVRSTWARMRSSSSRLMTAVPFFLAPGAALPASVVVAAF